MPRRNTHLCRDNRRNSICETLSCPTIPLWASRFWTRSSERLYESIRLHPYSVERRSRLIISPNTDRMSNYTPVRTRKATVLPLEYPVLSASGIERKSVNIPANTTIIISILAANHNRDVWGPDASEWKPERWFTAAGERVAKSTDAKENVDDGQRAGNTSEKKVGVRYSGVYGSM